MSTYKYVFLIFLCISVRAFALNVAVVGAGASGLTAAHYLLKHGHNVTIFEKNNRVGGKVYTYKIDDTTIELGGLLVTPGFKTINSLIDIYGPEPQTFPSQILFLNQQNQWRKFKGYSALGPLQTFVQYKRLMKSYKRFPELNTPQLISSIHPDLFLPLNQFARKYGFYEVLPPFVMSLSASGYLFPEVTPAYYALKLFKTIAPVGIQSYIENLNPFSSPFIKGLRSFKNGYSELWENMATHFDVRLNEKVISISNGKVMTTKDNYQFDRIVVSTDIQTARSIIMKPSQSLITFANGLKKHRFLVSVIETKDLPGKARHSYFFYPNMTIFRINHIQSMVNFWKNDKIFVTYQNLDDKIRWEDAVEILRQDLSTTLGMKSFVVRKRLEWSYFHHLPPGGYTREVKKALKNLQGQDGIYFVGESLNFESTESAAQNAKWVVEKYFKSYSHAP